MPETTTTETAKTQTDAATSTQATTETAATTLLTEAASTTEQATGEGTQTTETKTEAATTEQKTEAKTETKSEGAPDKYEFKDADKMDPTVLGSFSEAAKAANLTQDAAQKLLETMAPKLAERTQERVKAVHKQWTEASTTDKEFGGEKLKENLGVARKALDQFGSPELKTFLEDTGLGSHPDVIRMLYRVGKAISEDKFVGGSAVTTAPDPAKRMFPNQA
jgi:hypothetical protein